MTITEFLEARITEDEAQALKHQASASRHGWGDYTARVLAECAAKRKLIGLSGAAGSLDNMQAEYDIGYDDIENAMLLTMAAVYADHPDYRQEWAE